MKNFLVYTINNKEYALIDELSYDNRDFMYLIATDQSKVLIAEKILDKEDVIIKSVDDDKLFDKIALLFAKKIKERS